MRILVVDDVGYVRHYFDRLLTQHGHSVWTAASGFQALDVLKNEVSIQVVITDLLMPGMDGLEFYRAAQKIDCRDATGALAVRPVFYLITALRPSSVQRNETNLLQQALQLGFAEVLLKPIDNEHLLRQLARLEQKLLASEPAVNVEAVSNHAELLHVIDQSIERLLSRPDGESLAELVDLLQDTLTRIPAIVRQLDAQLGGQATALKHTPHLERTTGTRLVAENGLSTEKQ